MTETWELTVAKNDLSNTSIGALDSGPLAAGEVRFAINSYAMTANNITYAVMGEAMQYWDFFPAADGSGIVPVWGFGDVVESTVDGIVVGARYYGYWPTASHFTVTPTRVSDRGFTDGAAHRTGLPAVYNNYVATSADPTYQPELEPIQSLLRPLFTTSFFIDDFFDESDFYGAEAVLIASASSKTAFGLAYCLHKRGVKAIGLTSSGNVDFVESLGWYDSVTTYDTLDNPDHPLLQGPLAYVDMSGNAAVRANVHTNASGLVFDLMVGATHWDSTGRDAALPGPEPVMFFAPTQIAKRSVEWTPAGLDERLAASWKPFIAEVDDVLTVSTVSGAEGAVASYLSALDGSADPSIGVIVTA